MFLWIRLNSELLRYQGVQNFAKNNTENAELASKMLKQQHFLYQRKNLYDLMPSRSFSGDPTSDDNYRFLSLLEFFLFPHPRTLYLLVWRWGEGVAELEPGKFLAQRSSASRGVAPTVNKKLRLIAEHKAS